MEPFTCFMDVEHSRAYIDELYSDNIYSNHNALICLKNAVIGSNKQKGSIIALGVVPRLTSFLTLPDVPPAVRIDAAIVLGSLAKGSAEHVLELVQRGCVPILLGIVCSNGSANGDECSGTGVDDGDDEDDRDAGCSGNGSGNASDPRLIEACLCTLRSIFLHSCAPVGELDADLAVLGRIIRLASADSSIECQSCVAKILVPVCHSFKEQMLLNEAGVVPVLARLINSAYVNLQLPAIKCLAAMCFTNCRVAETVCGTRDRGVPLPDILTLLLNRSCDPDVQLDAARCLTYLHRTGCITSLDERIVYRTLPCLARLCTPDFSEEIRATSAETLAYLTEIDSELQRLASISNHLITSLSSLLRLPAALPRQGAFRCLASLGANDEDIRKRIIEMDGLMLEVLCGLADPCAEVRLSAVRCLHSLSRSVQQLRTTFQDHAVWRPLMTLLHGKPSVELMTVVTSTICNLLLEFSPAKEPMVESGAVELLCRLTHDVDAALRLNGIWALMNMAFQADEHIKTKIINTLGTDQIFRLLGDADTRVIMKTLGLLRNLLSKSMDIENIMSEHSTKLLQAVNLVLESTHPAEVKEQALCIVGNIASGAGATDYVMNDDRILHKLLDFMTANDTKLQEGAMFAIKNLIEKNDNNTPERLSKLSDLGVVDKLEAYLSMSSLAASTAAAAAGSHSSESRRPSEEYFSRIYYELLHAYGPLVNRTESLISCVNSDLRTDRIRFEMRAIPRWVEKIHDQTDGKESACIHSVCYHPDGTQLVVAAGSRVLVYEPGEGTLIEALKGHKDTVFCVAYARDGKKFASGGLDKCVIIWTVKLEGLLKYSHNDAIQCLTFNPVSHQLVSCTAADFAFWSAEQKAVQKTKVPARINCCAWTNDGQYLALGLNNGTVSIRNKAGEEKSRIERPGGPASPIYGLAISQQQVSGGSGSAGSGGNVATSITADSICVVDWSQSVSFYSLGGQVVGKERSIGFDALVVTYFPDGEFIAVAGCNKAIQLFTKEGIRLGLLGEQYEAWVWSMAIHPAGTSMIVGCQDGTVACYNLAFSTVHALYRERYAFRENMCDVIIQHLVSGQKVRIKCRDLVHKIAIFRNRLAVQLPERVVLYELNSAEHEPMHYKVREKIAKKFECSLLVVCAENLVLCQEKRLQSLDLRGQVQREWIMASHIRYIKVTGGPAGKEGLLLGLKSGEVWRIFLDNTLPMLVTTVQSAVRCLDLNSSRTKLAVVDDTGRMVVRDLTLDVLVYQEQGVNSVAWNGQLADMLCYSLAEGGGLTVRVGGLAPRAPQSMAGGVVVGVSGATAFCLRGNAMHSVPLALSATVWQFVERGEYNDAYQVACLGVPPTDWEALGHAALDALQLTVARDAFVRVRNLPWLQLINELIDRQRSAADTPRECLQADVLAFAGRFKEAARLYHKSGHTSRALAMYSDLRMFDLAQEFLDGSAGGSGDADRRELVRRRAEWACSVQEPRAAAELLMQAGEHERAIGIVAEQGWSDVLYDIGRRVAVDDRSALQLVAGHLRRLKALPLAAEIYRKLGDDGQVVQLHVEACDWPEAFRLAEAVPEGGAVLAKVHWQHAQWLAESDRFLEACEAYGRAGREQEAVALLRNLGECAIEEEQFLDAGYYVWLRARQVLQAWRERGDPNAALDPAELARFTSLHRLASIYYAYSTIHSYLREPFTTAAPLTLFNTSRFVANQISVDGGVPPKGISMFAILYTLSKQAKLLAANKLYLQVNNRLQSLKPPTGMQEQVDINFITSRACPGGFNDPEELLPMCYKCSNYSSHLRGNRCPTCQEEFVFSFVSFEILPLVRFHTEPDIDTIEAERLLLSPPMTTNGHHPNGESGNVDTMVHEDLLDTVGSDMLPLTLDRRALRTIDPGTVLIARWPAPLRPRYYRNLLPELQVTICPECMQAFHAEDYELQLLQHGQCPFCRTPAERLMNLY